MTNKELVGFATVSLDESTSLLDELLTHERVSRVEVEVCDCTN